MTPGKQARTGAKGVLLADRYRLEEPVAAGGMGEVWRATDTLLERSVAVKLLREALAEDPVVSERFRREALVAAQLSHPNMAGIYDYVTDNGRRGIVMEFVDGETLAERLGREGRLEIEDTIRIASALLAALKAAHAAGIVHRDVKPGNVMLTRAGDVKVTDFGIARAASDQTITETGMVIGTANYLSPEQVSGSAATPASDLYSVGAILYEMLTGRKPFEAETPLAVAMMRLNDDPTSPRSIRPDIPEPLEQVIVTAMARDPEDRYASADRMRSALEGAAAATRPAAPPVRVDPEPTQVLEVGEVEAAMTVAYAKPKRPARPSDKTGKAPAALVAERRRGEYKRLIVYALLLAVAIGLATLLFLALTGGESTVEVPTFTNMSLTEARSLAKQHGLTLRPQTVPSTERTGRVLTQNPEPGVEIDRDRPVDVTVASGPVLIPDLEGFTESAARRELEDLRLVVDDKIPEASSDISEGLVIGTRPAAGRSVAPSSLVDIVVSSGQPEERKDEGKNGDKKGNGGGEGNGG